jgi:hypothetical protein
MTEMTLMLRASLVVAVSFSVLRFRGVREGARRGDASLRDGVCCFGEKIIGAADIQQHQEDDQSCQDRAHELIAVEVENASKH